MSEETTLCYGYSRDILRLYSKSFYISTRLLPRRKQDAVFALYGFCRYADNLADKPRERSKEEILHEIGHLEDELKIAFRTGESEHPVICAFVKTAHQYKIPIEHPLELFKGIAMDLENAHYRNFKELHLFCHRVAGVVGLMMTHILGYVNHEAFTYAAKLGIAMQLTNILRDIEEDRENRRLYLPLDEMKTHHVTLRDLDEKRFTPELQNLMKFCAGRALSYYKEAAPGIHLLSPESRFAIQSASDIYRNILNQIEKNGYNPFLGRTCVSRNAKMRIILFNYIRGMLKGYAGESIDQKMKQEESKVIS